MWRGSAQTAVEVMRLASVSHLGTGHRGSRGSWAAKGSRDRQTVKLSGIQACRTISIDRGESRMEGGVLQLVCSKTRLVIMYA